MNARTPSRFLAFDSEARAEAVDQRIEELMQPGARFDPLEPSNFDEALSETLADFPSKNLPHLLAIALREGTPVNKLLIEMSANYNAMLAIPVAEDEIDAEREAAKQEQDESRSTLCNYFAPWGRV